MATSYPELLPKSHGNARETYKPPPWFVKQVVQSGEQPGSQTKELTEAAPLVWNVAFREAAWWWWLTAQSHIPPRERVAKVLRLQHLVSGG
jgi:hypothetical protein